MMIAFLFTLLSLALYMIGICYFLYRQNNELNRKHQESLELLNKFRQMYFNELDLNRTQQYASEAKKYPIQPSYFKNVYFSSLL